MFFRYTLDRTLDVYFFSENYVLLFHILALTISRIAGSPVS